MIHCRHVTCFGHNLCDKSRNSAQLVYCRRPGEESTNAGDPIPLFKSASVLLQMLRACLEQTRPDSRQEDQIGWCNKTGHLSLQKVQAGSVMV